MLNLRRRTLLPLLLGVVLLMAQAGGHAQPLPTDALRFFNNFFVTGNYVVGGVGLWNSGTGTIDMSSPAAPMHAAPEGADVLAAYLYWQVVTSVDPGMVDIHAASTFNGLPLSSPLDSQLVASLGGTQACLLNGGFGGAGNRVYTFRADVLRLMDLDDSGRRVVNRVGGYPVSLPNDHWTTRTLGASLVVIYRHPDPTTPLNAIVLYDGTFVKQQSQTLNQRIEGFYDPANVTGAITYIAGSAQSGLGEVLSVNTGTTVSVNNVFNGASGSAWDNVTRTTAALTGTRLAGAYFDTAIAPRSGFLGELFSDCISMGAMVYETRVNDFDNDGLLDRWELNRSTNAAPLRAPNGALLPYLGDMGADPSRKDIFVEIEAMQSGPATYGSEDAPLTSTLASVTDTFGHNHMPTPTALKMLGDAFWEHNIRLHLDVGTPAAYHALVPPNLPAGTVSPFASLAADEYLIGTGGSNGPPALAQGGELIPETACVPGPDIDCQFPDYPGTVSWKTGFQLYKERFFSPSRKDSFRFGLYAHAKASPKSLLPCEGASGPAGFAADGTCASGVTNPLIHVPAGVSGSADYPGGDFLITLGLWDNTNFVGNDFGVASTTMHELGHTLDLGHGGDPLPNCKPNYLSVMNYLFQLGGLVDADGVPHVGYSNADNGDLIEDGGLDEHYSVPGPYRTSWYAPWFPGDAGTPAKRFCNGLRFPTGWPPMIRIDGTPGSPIDWNADGDTNDFGLTQDVNFDGEPDTDGIPGPTTILTGYDDWAMLRLNQIGSRPNFAGFSIGPLGVRFLADGSRLLADGSRLLADGTWVQSDGTTPADGSRLLADGSRLLADGSRFLADRSVVLADGSRLLADGSRLLADGSDPLAGDGSRLLADGSRLLADGSVLLADGSVFLADGATFSPDGSVPLGDGVRFLADGSPLLADGSRLLADGATFSWDIEEPTPKSAAESGTTPGPHSLTACVIGGTGVDACVSGPSAPVHRNLLDWEAPTLGNLNPTDAYKAYRAWHGTEVELTAGSPVPSSQTAGVDNEELPNGEQFTYSVAAVLDDEEGTVTPRSNSKTITAQNDPPTAANDTYQGTSPAVVAGDVFANDTDADGVFNPVLVKTNWTAVLVSNVPSGEGVLTLHQNGTFTYSPGSFVGTTHFTYQVNTGTWGTGGPAMSANSNTATVTITVLPPVSASFTFQRADVWLSTSSASRKFDVKAEVLKNGVPVLEKVISNTTLGYGTTFNKAIQKQIGAFPATAVNFAATDTLSVRVSLKLSSSSPGGNNASGATRLWYNVPSPPGETSHLHATRAGADITYYLVTPFTLKKNGPVAGPSQYVDAIVSKTAYTVLGTWSVTGP